MKQCPTCNKLYDDDTLRFCLEDGETLIRMDKSGPPTMTMPGSKADDLLPTVAKTGGEEFQAPPPPATIAVEKAPRATKLIPYAIGIFVIGAIVCVLGIVKIVPGGIGTGAAFAFWGILLFAFSFIPLPQTKGDEEPAMSGLQKALGIFFEPTRVFRNLR